jgi:hypothetical protein
MYLMTRLISVSTFHLSLRVSLYSIAARSRAVTMPSLSDALAFHIRTLPSSEPVITNRASAENIEAETLAKGVEEEKKRKEQNKTLPLHPLRVIDLG